ncbi:hypothetical protein [Dickeya oryzae]
MGITKWYRFSQFNNRLASLAEEGEGREMIYCGMKSEKTDKKAPIQQQERKTIALLWRFFSSGQFPFAH